jgi:hypothetical protein
VSQQLQWLFSDASHCWKHCWVVGKCIQLQALRREVGVGVKPLPETMVALARLFGAKGQLQRGEEVLAAMEKLNHDPRVAWLVLVEELFRAGYRSEANSIFLRGANGGLRGTNELYDMLVDENCKVGDHENAIDILRVMEYAGRMSTTFHYNCLLRAQANAGVPDIAAMTFETMQYGRGVCFFAHLFFASKCLITSRSFPFY